MYHRPVEFSCTTIDRDLPLRVTIDANQNVKVAPGPGAAVTPPKDQWLISSGLVDLQVNGYLGTDLSDPNLSVEHAESFCRQLAGVGVTRLLPTITTNSHQALIASLRRLSSLSEESDLFSRMTLGIHLEGPFISKLDGPRGAHPREFCRPCDLNEFALLQQAAQGLIKVVTLSPEYESATSFIAEITRQGLIASIGHTAASPEQIQSATQQGAQMSTHLGNGMHTEIARHPNYLWEQMASDELHAGLIADGVHLSPAILKSIVRTKTPQKCFLVSDTTSLSGQPAGRYRDSVLGDVEVTDDRRLVIAGQRLLQAGAYKPLKDAIPIIMRDADVSFTTALKMASEFPAAAIGHRDSFPFDPQSCTGDFIVFHRDKNNRCDVKLAVVNNDVLFSNLD